MFDFQEIFAAALRDHPEDETFRKWLVGPKPRQVKVAVRDGGLIPYLAKLYPCGNKLHGLMVRAGQDTANLLHDPKQSRRFLTKHYIKWHRAIEHAHLLDAENDDRAMAYFMDPILPEKKIRQLAVLYPTTRSVIDLCHRAGIIHRYQNEFVGESSLLRYLELSNPEGIDLWTELYRESQMGSVIQFTDLLMAAIGQLN